MFIISFLNFKSANSCFFFSYFSISTDILMAISAKLRPIGILVKIMLILGISCNNNANIKFSFSDPFITASFFIAAFVFILFEVASLLKSFNSLRKSNIPMSSLSKSSASPFNISVITFFNSSSSFK